MKIGFMGAGNMARSMGIGWAELGHAVFFGSRDPARGARLAAFAGHGARGGGNAEAAAFGDIVVFTVRERVPSDVLDSVAPLAGKVLLDINNRALPADSMPGAAIGESLAERIAADVPAARVVKGYNTMAQEVFEHPPEILRQQGVSMFLCGDDDEARALVAGLAREHGLIPVDCGGLGAARMVEGLGDFIRYMMRGRDYGLFATVNFRTIPAPARERLGGRGYQP